MIGLRHANAFQLYVIFSIGNAADVSEMQRIAKAHSTAALEDSGTISGGGPFPSCL
jgi:hypothetical protein